MTIARAIAHFCLHRNEGNCFVQDHESVDRYQEFWCPLELQTMIFAEYLLMPASAVMDFCEKNGDMDRGCLSTMLANEFDVPVFFAEKHFSEIVGSIHPKIL